MVAGLAALLGGRWLAVSTANALWARSLGVAATHQEFSGTRTALVAVAFAVAVVWSVGNTVLVYRSIRSVHVPRTLGDLEIVEAVPRRLLLAVAVGLGLAIAIAVSLGTGDWWQDRILARYDADVGLRDAVLGRDVAYYLFRLPWHRTLHTFAILLAGVVAAAVAALYVALGAVRWSRRRLQVTALARRQLAVLSAVLALALFWGYRLEPLEYAAGIHDVPIDAVLTAVRIPVARMLSVVALLVVIGSLLWLWTARLTTIALAWLLLGMASFAGHYVAPSFAAAVRSTDELRIPDAEVRRQQFEQLAYGVSVEEKPLFGAEGGQRPVTIEEEVPRPVLWDGFAVTVLLDRLATESGYEAFTETSLGVYGGSEGSEAVPVYVAARVTDMLAARDAGVDLTWESVHLGPLALGRGAVAVQAHAVSETGLPRFVSDLSDPQAASSQVQGLVLEDDVILVAPGLTDFAVVEATDARTGVSAGGFARRLALAWTLQSPGLVTSERVTGSSIVVWHRDVVARLERFAPFARFGRPRAVIENGRLRWVANGYVSADGFPLAPRVRWRNQTVRYLRSGLIGAVDAHSGDVVVYLTRDADPLSLAWAELAKDIVRPAAHLPAGLRPNLPYPEELLSAIVPLLQRSSYPSVLVGRPLVPPTTDGTPLGHEPYWWVGSAAADSVPRLRLLVPLEERESGMLAGLLDATIREAAQVLDLYRTEGADALLGPGQLTREFSRARGDLTGIEGIVRLLPTPRGVLGVQSLYVSSDEAGTPPRLIDVGLSLEGVVGNGPSFSDALSGLQIEAAPGIRTPRAWGQARVWFQRMDAARRAGDWAAFGRAYEELRGLLVGGGDPVP